MSWNWGYDGGGIIELDEQEGDDATELADEKDAPDVARGQIVNHDPMYIKPVKIIIASRHNQPLKLEGGDDCTLKVTFTSRGKVQVKFEAEYHQATQAVEAATTDRAEEEALPAVGTAGEAPAKGDAVVTTAGEAVAPAGGKATAAAQPKKKKAPTTPKDCARSIRLILDNHAISRFDQRFHEADKNTIGISFDLVAPIATKNVLMVNAKTDSFEPVDLPDNARFVSARAATRIIVWFDASTDKARTTAHTFVERMLQRDADHLGDLAQGTATPNLNRSQPQHPPSPASHYLTHGYSLAFVICS